MLSFGSDRSDNPESMKVEPQAAVSPPTHFKKKLQAKQNVKSFFSLLLGDDCKANPAGVSPE